MRGPCKADPGMSRRKPPDKDGRDCILKVCISVLEYMIFVKS